MHKRRFSGLLSGELISGPVMAASLLVALCFAQLAGGGESHSPLDAFQSRYREIMQAVDQGALPLAVGTDAKTLWMSVQKRVIRATAQIEALRVEAVEYEGLREEKALDDLIRASAERERILLNASAELERLAVNLAHAPQSRQPSEPPAAETPASSSKELEAREGRKKTTIQIEFEPEDPTTGEFP